MCFKVRRHFYPRMGIELELAAPEPAPKESSDKRTRRSKNFGKNPKFNNKRKKIRENHEINNAVKKKKK